MRTYEEIMAGSENGPVVVPGDVANSKLVELVASQKMPQTRSQADPAAGTDYRTVWVAAG
jgi:hypothetical protein